MQRIDESLEGNFIKTEEQSEYQAKATYQTMGLDLDLRLGRRRLNSDIISEP